MRWNLVALCLACIFYAAAAASCNRNPESYQKNKMADAGKSEKVGSVKIAQPSLEQVLASVPCKLDNKLGGYVLFPSNTIPGQQCFSLAPGDPALGVTAFDIQSNDMVVVFHDDTPRSQESVTLQQTTIGADGAPCLDPACLAPVHVATTAQEDSSNPGWNWLMLTTKASADLISGQSAYVVTVDGQAQFPVFK